MKVATGGIGFFSFLFAFLAVASAQTPLGAWQDGRSTYYSGIDGGNCGYEGIPATSFPFRKIAGSFSPIIVSFVLRVFVFVFVFFFDFGSLRFALVLNILFSHLSLCSRKHRLLCWVECLR